MKKCRNHPGCKGYVRTPIETVELTHGSLVVMPAGSQEFFVHQLKKATKKQGDGKRINLTFRMMVDPRP